MPRHTKAQTEIYITAAATLFVRHTRDANEIASLLDTTDRSIHRWSKQPRWTEVLDTLNYDGERHFRVRQRRDLQRDDPNFEAVRDAYSEAIAQGVPKNKRISTVAAQTGVKNWKVREWVRRFGWSD